MRKLGQGAKVRYAEPKLPFIRSSPRCRKSIMELHDQSTIGGKGTVRADAQVKIMRQEYDLKENQFVLT